MSRMNDESVRTDQWLWAARFFKTRALAASALKNGRVLVNGQRSKPGRCLARGALLSIHNNAWLRYEVCVLTLAKRRVGAAVAATLYQETDAGRRERLAMAERQKQARQLVTFPANRPDKRARRSLRNLRQYRNPE